MCSLMSKGLQRHVVRAWQWHADLNLIISKAAHHAVVYKLFRVKSDDLTVPFRSFSLPVGTLPMMCGSQLCPSFDNSRILGPQFGWKEHGLRGLCLLTPSCVPCLVVLPLEFRWFLFNKRSATYSPPFQMGKQEFRNLKAASQHNDEAQDATI